MQLAEQVLDDDAYPSLLAVVGDAEASGWEPRRLLGTAIHERSLADASSVADVLHWRITRRLERPALPGPTAPPTAKRLEPGQAGAFLATLDSRIVGAVS